MIIEHKGLSEVNGSLVILDGVKKPEISFPDYAIYKK